MIPYIANFFIESACVQFVDNGRPPRWLHDWGHNRKKGLVNHIPVCETLQQLRDYFLSGSALGSTQFGIGRDVEQHFTYNGWTFPVARVDQYMPIKRNAAYPQGCAPWAQGSIVASAACPIPMTPAVSGMRQGEPNGAFYSIENVAWQGSDGMTDAQFNSNVLLRAYLAGLDEFPINPLTNLWHAEIDQRDRCSDPGWGGALEDAAQSAAVLVLANDISGLRGRTGEVPPIPQPSVTLRSEIVSLREELVALNAKLNDILVRYP